MIGYIHPNVQFTPQYANLAPHDLVVWDYASTGKLMLRKFILKTVPPKYKAILHLHTEKYVVPPDWVVQYTNIEGEQAVLAMMDNPYLIAPDNSLLLITGIVHPIRMSDSVINFHVLRLDKEEMTWKPWTRVSSAYYAMSRELTVEESSLISVANLLHFE